MRKFTMIAALIAAAGAASAQDSVALTGGLPGDALDATDPSQQCRNYVVDLSPIQTSWGTTFGVAPILKGTRDTSSAFFTGFVGAHSISPDLVQDVPAASGSYLFWENSPGSGIHGEFNQGATSVFNPTGMTSQFALGFNEFSNDYTGVVGAVINYKPDNANRLLVTRKHVASGLAVHDATDGLETAQFGGLSNDANGNFYVRADDFFSGATGPSPISGNNIFRVRLLDRTCGQTNLISSTFGDPGASDGLVMASGTTHIVANNLPATIAGGAGLVAVPNFDTEYVYGAGPVVATTTHMAASVTGLRGSIGLSTRFGMGGNSASIATMGLIGQDANFDTKMINLWSVNNSGSVVAGTPVGFTIPASVTDNWDGKVISLATAEFKHHRSQTAFRGGNGQIALGMDQGGMAMAAGTLAEFALQDDASNQLVVATFDPANPAATVSWSMAAYIDIASSGGKVITDGAGTNIGQLTPLFNVTGGSPLGPSISNPTIDSVGNIWFLSAVELFDRLPGGGSDFDTALIRAVKDSAGADAWELELVLELGTQIQGLNSGLPYAIQFFSIADSNSASSSTMCSTSAAQNAWNNTATAGLDTKDPITNGGVVVSTDITYDVDMDGDFEDPTSGGGNPASLDESYQVLLYVSYFQDDVNPCLAIDFTGDGIIDAGDLGAFITGFLAGDVAFDLTGDGIVDAGDLGAFISLYITCTGP